MLRYREHVIGSCCYLNTVDGKAIEPRSRIMMVNLHKMRLRKYDFLKNDNTKDRKVASSRPVYYSILNSLGQRSQYISIKFPLHKSSENPKMC